MPNRLARETSPYLLQHAHNPVDWYPWGPEALERARAEDRPILLSIGYAACHWCHVMEHESFEDPETARVMNELFVNIKVDREERPDVDAVYMQAVQAMTGHGGWPMTMFLTPAGEPYYGGTYFPPADRQGMPSFRRVLASAADAYRGRRESVTRMAQSIREQVYAAGEAPAERSGAVTPATLARAYRAIAAQYDAEHGGSAGAPKFPQAMAHGFLLRHWARTGTAEALAMVRATFAGMVRGGIYDQVGGGFHRYSVDAHWLVPHFEKMLYDNALLARLGVELWQATGDPLVRQATEETLDWVAREMTSPAGGFYSTLDADSEGEEGKFYVWGEAELDALLGDDAAAVKAYYGVTAAGNFEGHNILHRPAAPGGDAAEPARAAAAARARPVLYEARARRVWPGRDEKVLAGWNGLMLRAVALAAAAFDRDDYRATAVANGEFLRREMVRDGGRVMRSHKDGVTRIPGFLEDHAAVALGFVALHELTFERRWLDAAREVAGAVNEWFWDEAARAFFDTARDAEPLITRPRDVADNAVPSGTSLAAELLLHLGVLLDDQALRDRARWVLETLAEPMARYGQAFGQLLGAADMAVHGATEVALVGEPGTPELAAIVRTLRTRYVPALVVAAGRAADDAVALLARREAIGGRPTAYLCRGYACELPATEPDAFAAQLAAVLAPAARPAG
jgi:uncharacterized protein YyaL (SSP411 family)